MTKELACIIVAPCFLSELNVQFDNPDMDPTCHCGSCSRLPISPAPQTQTSCNCSGSACNPEPTLSPLPHSGAVQQSAFIPMAHRLTDEMRELGEQKLKCFHWNLWDCTSNISLQYAPPSVFLPDSNIKNILDNFASIITAEDVASYVQDVHALASQYNVLFTVICGLWEIFQNMKHAQPTRRHEEQSSSIQSPSTPTVFPATAYDDFFASLCNPGQCLTLLQSRSQPSHGSVVVDLSNASLDTATNTRWVFLNTISLQWSPAEPASQKN